MGVFTFNNLLSVIRLNGLGESFLLPMILNMTITGSVVILFVLLVRLLLEKAPKIFSYALWAVVLFRLLCPVSVTTDFSLLGLFDTPAVENTQHTTAVEYIPYDVVHTPNLDVQLPVSPAINDAVNEALPQEHAALGADPLEGEFAIGSLIWLLGIGAMAIYSAVSYILLRRKLVGSVLLRDNIYLADGIGSPFVMGFIRPKIYLPSALSEREQGYIILHEQHHIRRGDHLIKVLAFIALCIHWFNPLVWVAFVLSSKDMEMSCDEAVVKKLGEGIRADYSASLLSLATGRPVIAGTPLAFGEGDTKSRIKNMLNWKRAKPTVIGISLVVVAVIAAVCATNPRNYTYDPAQDNLAAYLSEVRGAYRGHNEQIEGVLTALGTAALGKYEWKILDVNQNNLNPKQYGVELKFSGDLESPEGFGSAVRSRAIVLLALVKNLSQVCWETPEGNRTAIDFYEAELLAQELGYSGAKQLCKTPEGVQVLLEHLALVEVPQDFAQTLYELRVPSLENEEDPGAQIAIRSLLDVLGASELGPYELEYYDLTRADHVSTLNLGEHYWPGGTEAEPPYKKTALVIRFTEPFEPDDPRPLNQSYGDLLLALVPELDEVHIANKRTNSPTRYSYIIRDEDSKETAEALGAKNIEVLGQSARGIRALLEYLDWTGITDPEATGHYGTAGDVAYYLELAAGTEFRTMTIAEQTELLVEYEDLLDGYLLRARKSVDGKTAYIVGQYNGNPTESPLYGMYSIDMYTGEEEYFRFLYREEEAETVEAVVSANKTEFPPSTGYRIEDSLISWTDNSGVILIQPKDNTLLLDVPWNRYFYTRNGREYIADAVSRGIDVCGRTDTFLYIYRISERFGEISERIALTEAEAAAIQAEERVKITDGFGFSATLHIDGQTTYYNEREGIPQTVLDMAVEKCDYRFGDPSYITNTIREAKLECDWLDTALYADEADLPRLREILKNAEHGYVGSCGYGAKLTLTFTGGEKLTVFKGCDGCDTIVFGSYGGYFLGEKENIEFWEMFGLDPDTKECMETNPADIEAATVFSIGDLLLEVTGVQSTRRETMLDDGGNPHEYSVYTYSPGATITVKKAGMRDGRYFEDGQPHAVWGVSYTGEKDRTRITDETTVIPITPELEGIYHLESSMFVLKFESTSQELPTETEEIAPEEPAIETSFMPPTDADIRAAILSTIPGADEGATRFRTEFHRILAQEGDETTYTFYMVALRASYDLDESTNQTYAMDMDSCWQTTITFTKEEDGWRWTDYWFTAGAENLEERVRERFPIGVAEQALGDSFQTISAELHRQGEVQAEQYYAELLSKELNVPFTDQSISWESPLNGMFERTYETQLQMMGNIDQTYPPFFQNQVLEFSECAVLVGVSPDIENDWTHEVTAYILFRDGALGRLPLPLDMDGFRVGPTVITDNGNGTLSYSIKAHGGTCHYTVNLGSYTVSMTIS